MSVDLIIAGGSVVTGDAIIEAALAIDGELIVAIGDEERLPTPRQRIDARGLAVLPGVIDPHVHFGVGGAGDEAKFTSDMRDETKAAALGGITTFVTDHECEVGSSLITTTEEAEFEGTRMTLLEKAKRLGERHSTVDFRYTANPQTAAHLHEIPRLLAEGVSSFKFYPAFHRSGEKDWGVARVDWGFLHDAFARLARARSDVDVPLGMIHCEELDICAALKEDAIEAGVPADLRAWNGTRPPLAEAMHVFSLGMLALRTGARGYVVHVSSEDALDTLRYVKSLGADVVGETCAHYLVLTEDAPLGPLGKTNPPLRSARDREALWDAVVDGTVELIGSDDCGRYTVQEKESQSYWDAIPGFSEMAATLSLLATHGVAAGRIGWPRLAQLISTNAARYFGMYPRKGSIAVGADADLVTVDPDTRWTMSHAALAYASDFSIYEGQVLVGRPVHTILRGKMIVERGELRARAGGCYVADSRRG